MSQFWEYAIKETNLSENFQRKKIEKISKL